MGEQNKEKEIKIDALKPIQDELYSMEKDKESLAKIGEDFAKYYVGNISPYEEASKKFKKDDISSIITAAKAVVSYNKLKDGIYKALYGKEPNRSYRALHKAADIAKNHWDSVKKASKGILDSSKFYQIQIAIGEYNKAYATELNKNEEERKIYSSVISELRKRARF